MLAVLIGELGYPCDFLTDSREVLPKLREGAFEIAFIDIGMPHIDGWALARQIRREFDPDKLRLVALTAYGQHADRTNSRRAGFDAHLQKPADHDLLVAALDHLERTK